MNHSIKKLFSLFLALSILCSVLLTGCGSSGSVSESNTGAQSDVPSAGQEAVGTSAASAAAPQTPEQGVNEVGDVSNQETDGTQNSEETPAQAPEESQTEPPAQAAAQPSAPAPAETPASPESSAPANPQTPAAAPAPAESQAPSAPVETQTPAEPQPLEESQAPVEEPVEDPAPAASEATLVVRFGDGGDPFTLYMKDNVTANDIVRCVGTAAWRLPIYHYDDYDGWESFQYYDIPSRYEITPGSQSITSAKAGEVYYSEPNRIILFYHDAEISGDYTLVGTFTVTDEFVAAVENNPVLEGWGNKIVNISID